MAVTLNSTGVTFSDGTAQASASTPYAIGTYTTGRPLNLTNYAVNSTLAGSSLYSTPTHAYLQATKSGLQWVFAASSSVPAPPLISVGSWRAMSPAIGNSGNVVASGLWVRYA